VSRHGPVPVLQNTSSRCSILNLDETARCVCTHMQEYCNGKSLRELLSCGGLTPVRCETRWASLITILTHIAFGMRHMHANRICHGDLNPSNVLLKVRLFLGLVSFFLAWYHAFGPGIMFFGLISRLGRSSVNCLRSSSAKVLQLRAVIKHLALRRHVMFC
jgi:serine/threonine protein kinase